MHVNTTVEALIGWRFTPPLGVNHMATGARRNRTSSVDVRIAFIGTHIGIGTGIVIVVRQITERLILKIGPGQLLTHLIDKARLGDPIAEIRGVIKVRAVADIPGKHQASRVDIVNWPVDGIIPGSFTPLPGFTIETAHILCDWP